MDTMTTRTMTLDPNEEALRAWASTHRGFSAEALRAQFDRICDPADWKGPIGVWVPGEAVLLTVAAVEFMTATTPRVELDVARMRYRVTSEGYRRGPAGDR